MGGGSNILAHDAGFPGVVIHIENKGKEVIEERPGLSSIKVGAGEVLDDVVAWAVSQNWWGIENLSFVPGLTGALVIQNVGAYGAKAEDIVESVEVIDSRDLSVKTFTNEECRFGYRGSIFNREEKGRYAVLSVTLRLSKVPTPNISYRDVRAFFESAGNSNPSLLEIRNAITEIRKRKGQDPNQYWSAGSFFKNFLLTNKEYESAAIRIGETLGLEKAREFASMKETFKKWGDKSDGGKIKTPIGYILDKLLNLKGFSEGGAKISELQVINIVNTGNASAEDVFTLFKKVQAIVLEKTGLLVVHEPEFLGFDGE